MISPLFVCGEKRLVSLEVYPSLLVCREQLPWETSQGRYYRFTFDKSPTRGSKKIEIDLNGPLFQGHLTWKDRVYFLFSGTISWLRRNNMSTWTGYVNLMEVSYDSTASTVALDQV